MSVLNVKKFKYITSVKEVVFASGSKKNLSIPTLSLAKLIQQQCIWFSA